MNRVILSLLFVLSIAFPLDSSALMSWLSSEQFKADPADCDATTMRSVRSSTSSLIGTTWRTGGVNSSWVSMRLRNACG